MGITSTATHAVPAFLSIVPPAPAFDSSRAEQSLLGALLVNPGLLAHLPPTFRPEHYSDDWHRELHEFVVTYGEPGIPAALPAMQRLAAADDERREYIASLITAAVSFSKAGIRPYAEAVTDMHRRREMYEAGRRMQDLAASQPDVPATHVIAEAQVSLDALAERVDIRGAHIAMDDAMDEAMARADRVFARGSGLAGISTGFRSVDDRLGGLEPGTMTVLGGRPSMGKSSLGWQWAISAARAGEPVLVLSLEMTAEQLGARALSIASGVPLELLRTGRHGPYADRLIAGRRELGGLKLSICDLGGQTSSELAFHAKAAKRRFGRLGLIMVDHLHIVRAEAADVRAGATWAVGQISRAMKALAKTMSCPVLVLAQLNRLTEGRDDKRPGMADLRQAGDIEQDADAICLLYRAEQYLGSEPERSGGESVEKFSARLAQWRDDKERLRGKAELICPKVRDGEPGSVLLNFNGPTTSFSEIGA